MILINSRGKFCDSEILALEHKVQKLRAAIRKREAECLGMSTQDYVNTLRKLGDEPSNSD